MTKCLLNEGRREADLRFAGFIVVLLIAISLSCGFQSTFSSSESRVQAAKFIRRNYLCAATIVHVYICIGLWWADQFKSDPKIFVASFLFVKSSKHFRYFIFFRFLFVFLGPRASNPSTFLWKRFT